MASYHESSFDAASDAVGKLGSLVVGIVLIWRGDLANGFILITLVTTCLAVQRGVAVARECRDALTGIKHGEGEEGHSGR